MIIIAAVLFVLVNESQSWTIISRPLAGLWKNSYSGLLRRPYRNEVEELSQQEVTDHRHTAIIPLEEVVVGSAVGVTDEDDEHDVLRLIRTRTLQGSLPGNRTDAAKLALCIEGGGMRGAVAAGMAAALPMDAFDVVYGSSAGALIGAYAVARQSTCLDVYQHLVHSQDKFVSTKRFVANMGLTLIDNMFDTNLANIPFMNLSYVFDDILSLRRPIDMDTFRKHNDVQPLRVVVSCFDNCTLSANTFGYGDRIRYGHREGLDAALEASMSVPAATGQLQFLHRENSTSVLAMDGFCREPIPYRSAVADGATHVLALCTKSSDFMPKRSMYESIVTPLFFHRLDSLRDYFHGGGQQEIYADDLRLMSHAKGGAPVDVDGNQAYILPVQLPTGSPELGTVQLDAESVRTAIVNGYEAARRLLGDMTKDQSFENIMHSDHQLGQNT
jgi:predicted acylesterase/phospholipase RssA